MDVMLAIESSQRESSVALRLGDGEIDEDRLGSADTSETLMAAIALLCARNRIQPPQLSSITVDVGPGGFTGLRTGVITAKVLAEITGARLVGVPGALVAAEESTDLRARPELRRILVLLAVKRRESASSHAGTAWCAVLSRLEAGAPWSMDAPAPSGHLVTLESLEPGAPAEGWGTQATLAEASQLPDLAHRHREAGTLWLEPRWSARACLRVAQQGHLRTLRSDPAALTPIYGREAEAVTRWDALRGRGAQDSSCASA